MNFDPITLEICWSRLIGVVNELERSFVRQRRMKLSGEYKPCYRIVA